MTRALAAAATLAALAVAAWQLPGELRRYDNTAAAAGAGSGSRELPAASLAGVDPQVFERIARFVPRDAIFYVAVPPSRDFQELAFQSLAPYALLPRRHAGDVRAAGWVVAFHVDPRGLGPAVARVVSVGSDVVVAEVAR